MIKHLLLLVFCSTASFSSIAQQSGKSFVETPVKFGKVELAEFETRPGGKDSAASAIKLFDKGDLRFEINNKTGGFRYVFSKHTRILLLKKDAYDLANIEIGLYKSDQQNEEVLTNFTAATYNKEKGEIATYKLGKDAKFADKFDKNTTIKKFTLANIKEGSIIEYRYEIKSDFIFNLRDWKFQGSIPTLLSDFTVTIPEYFNYKKLLRGFAPVTMVEQKEIPQNFSASITTESFKTEQIAVKCNSAVERYVGTNIPALKDEPFITTLEDYISKIEFEINSTQFPNSTRNSYTETWDKIISKLQEDENFGGLLKNSNYGKNLTAGIVKSENNPIKKIEAVHSFVKYNVKFNGEQSKYAGEKSIKRIVETKAGNVADINLLLVNLLNEAGLNAYPILISTRSNGVHPGYPLIGKFNYVLAGVVIDSTKYILDATSITNGLDLIGFDCLNHKGLALNMAQKTAEWLPVELKKPSQSFLSYQLKLDSDNNFTGIIHERKTEYSGLATRERYRDSQNLEEYLKEYKRNRNGLKIDSFQIKNLDSLSSPLTVTYQAMVEDMVEEAGNLIYFSPLLYERTKENPFKLDERNFPVDFGYANEEIYRISIEIPANMQVDKLPKSELFKLADNSANFSYISASDGKRINIVSKITIAKSWYDADSYFELKELFKKIVSKQAEQIVLKKI